MLKGMLSDVTGGADVCTCVPREQFGTDPAMQYVLPEEQPFIFLRATKEQYIFTDQAFICIRGNSGASTKRLVSRFDFDQHHLTNVRFETAGMSMTDLDCEIKFGISGEEISIDIEKRQTDSAIHCYRALVDLARTQHQNAVKLKLALTAAIQKAPKVSISDSGLEGKLAAISADTIQWTEAVSIKYCPESYKATFLRHFPGNS